MEVQRACNTSDCRPMGSLLCIDFQKYNGHMFDLWNVPYVIVHIDSYFQQSVIILRLTIWEQIISCLSKKFTYDCEMIFSLWGLCHDCK